MLDRRFAGQGRKERYVLASINARPRAPGWLAENGPKELENLLRTVVFHPAAPIVVTDNDRTWREASVGAGKLLGLPRQKLIGHSLDDFAAPAIKPVISSRWQTLLKEGEQTGSLQLVGSDGTLREVEYTAKTNVLPERHLLVLRDQTKTTERGIDPYPKNVPSLTQDYALFLVDVEGRIATWYAGAERIFGYPADEAVGQHLSFLFPAEDTQKVKVQAELNRAAVAGHRGTECWCIRSDSSRFWANAITMALKDEQGGLQGFSCVVRDFSDRRAKDEELRRGQARLLSTPRESAIAGVVSGEFDRIPEANDTFLELIGYSRDDLLAGQLVWPDLKPPEYLALDELAHEEGLLFGACTPFEQELFRKDGTRVPVLVTMAVLQLSPFRWIAFVSDTRQRDRHEKSEGEAPEVLHQFEEIIGNSASLKRMLAQVEVVAPTDATVLLLGETGTGKELVARAIHRLSSRRNRSFISLNCGAIPTGLLESELFGYERGAFTGALRQKIGRFEMAHGGTLFLDEVGDIPLNLQPKLLRALQEKSIERLGGTGTIPIDVRLVAATNRNLTQMVGDKLFRSDLYYRLKVFPIITPPLRDHAEDIPVLAWHFTKKYAAKMDREIDDIPAETMKALVSWPWPGNVRELEHFIERSVILTQGTSLRAPISELRYEPPETPGGTLEDVERTHILGVLEKSGGVVSTAAIRLGIPRTTLNAMMKRLGIFRNDS